MNVGTATVTITGAGNYSGTKTQTFTIVAKAASTLTIDAIANQTYTGTALTPVVVVKDGATTLTATTDYTVAYAENTNVGTATVTITGAGNYTGTKTQTFAIVKLVSTATIDPIANQTYTGTALTPAVVVKDGATTLTLTTDYTVAYTNNTIVGTATATITGIGNFTGTKTQTFSIVAKAASTLTIDALANQTYSGSALTPAVVVKDGNTTLTLGTDYTVAYTANTNVGTATATITSIGNYTGTKTQTFTIVPKVVSTLTIDAIPNQTYTGSALTPVVVVKDGATTLTATTDYSVTYTNNTNVGTATVTITGVGNYSGTKTQTFAIVKLVSSTTIDPIANQTYSGSALTPALVVKDGATTLTLNTDYTVAYTSNTIVGTATATITGIGNFTGTKTQTFTIVAKAANTLTIDAFANQTYSGSALTPAVVVKDGNTTLTLGTDYTVDYTANTNVGTATATITGIGNYTGTKTQTFGIVAKAASTLTIDAIANQTYSGSALTPTVVVKDGNATLTLDADYTVTYSSNINVGTANVTVTGRGNYTSTKAQTFVITAKAASTLTIDAIASQTYTGAALTPVVVVKNGNTTLTLGTDYTVAYSSNTNAGTATVTVTGTGNFINTKTQTFVITAKAASTLTIDGITSQTYSGSALTPAVVVKNGNATLTLGTDYTVTYLANKNAGTATVKITCVGNFVGEASVGFEILKKKVTVRAENKERNFGEQNPILTYKYEGLVPGDQKIAVEPSVSTSAKSDSSPGNYPILLAGGSDPNYEVVLVNGILKVVDSFISVVRNLQGVVDNQTIEVSWEKPQEFVSEILGYKLEISEDSLNYVLLTKTEKLTFKVEDLVNSQKYWIKVNAYSLFSSGEEKVIGPLIPIAPAVEDVVVTGNQVFGETVVVINGEKVEPTIQTSENSVSIKVGDIVMDLGGSSESGGKLPIVDGVLLLEPKGNIELKGGGFKSNTSIAVWLIQNSAATTGGRLGNFNPYLQSRLIEGDNKYQFSSKVVGAKAGTAYFLGYSDVDANGNFTSDLEIPENLIFGRFTLQARGIGKGGEPASINLGAIVTEDLTLDTDGDQVPDYIESREGTNPKDSASFLDTDKDGVPDQVEKNDGKDFKNPSDYQDSDGDKVPDYVEKKDGTSLSNPTNYLDKDGDEVPNYIELKENTELDDPGNYLDTDGDLVPDYIESRDGTDVKNSKSFKDTDLDGVPDYVQVRSIKSSTLEEVVLTWGLANHLSKLPAKVDVKIHSGENKSLDVVWNNTGTLNILKRGTYELSGTITVPKGYFNAYNIKGKVRVVVLPKPAPRDVTISNNSFAASAAKYFISIGDFLVNDPVDKIHVVRLFGDGYDNKFFEIKDNILFWNSADPAAGKTTFNIVVQVTDRDGNTIEKFFEIRRSRSEFASLPVYSAFTPNGDRFNDAWGVPELRFYQGVRILVFEKDGKPLFSTENPDVRWDGTHNGKEMPVGSYFWIINIGETGEMRRGILNLIRK
jgi:gliding motility-associated-like protein